MEILTRAEVIAAVPDRWKAQYANYDTRRDPSKLDILAKLQAMKGTEYTAEEVNDIIGNDTWTTISCDECEKKAESLMMMVTDSEWGGHKVGLCAECLSSAALRLMSQNNHLIAK